MVHIYFHQETLDAAIYRYTINGVVFIRVASGLCYNENPMRAVSSELYIEPRSVSRDTYVRLVRSRPT